MSPSMEPICSDLAAETEVLTSVLAEAPDESWELDTPSVGWTIRDQVSHLIYYDETAVLAVTDPESFRASVADLLASLADGDPSVGYGHTVSGEELLARFGLTRARLVETLAGIDAKDRIDWYGPSMGALSFATARLMETWAHGVDVFDSLGAVLVPTDRLRHICHIGVRARPFAFGANGIEMPDGDVRVEVTGPAGDTWTWGPPGAADRVEAPALDFALLVTRRRHPDDLDLSVEGPLAEAWVGIAQAFAGPPGPIRSPR